MPPREGGHVRSPLDQALAAIARRLRIQEALRASSLAVVAGTAVWSVVRLAGALHGAAFLIAVGATAVAAFVAWMIVRRARWTRHEAAGAIERANPSSRNVVLTAEELERHPERAHPSVRDRVFVAAGRISQATSRADAVPLRKQVVLTAILVPAAIAAAAMTPAVSAGRDANAAADVARDSAPHRLLVTAIITPPPYLGEGPRTLENPDRLEVVAGSRLRLVLRSRDAWRVRLGRDDLTLRQHDGDSVVDVAPAESGYLAFEPRDRSGDGERRLIPLAVTPDRVPTIRIDAPAKDLLLADGKSTVRISATATDDFALESLDLRYTTVSGSGEQFEFNEGSIPLEITRASEREWTARARLVLAAQQLAPGDSLLYRFVGRDRRPGQAGLAASETYFIEIAGPGQVALEGFELPPDRERYALSQQMIVLKLERLRARERALARPALEEEVVGIAAEQRAVRSNFIFLTGGTVEDEEEEAAHSHEIQEGRLENTARREIGAAIQFMGRVEQALAAIDTAAALPPAKAAVQALQRAFGRNRYFLRTLPSRSRVDPARRLSGELATAGDWRRELFPRQADEPVAAARTLLARLLELAPQIEAGSLPAAAVTALAEQALSIAPAAGEWQRVAQRLAAIGNMPSSDAAGRQKLLNEIVSDIVPLTGGHRLGGSGMTDAERALRGAWQEGRSRK